MSNLIIEIKTKNDQLQLILIKDYVTVTEWPVPMLRFNRPNLTDPHAYYKSMARYIITCIDKIEDTVLVLHNPIFGSIYTYLQNKLPISGLILLVDKKKETYYESLMPQTPVFSGSNEIEDILKASYILSDKIICSSENIRKDLIQGLHINAKKISTWKGNKQGNPKNVHYLIPIAKIVSEGKRENDTVKLRRYYFALNAEKVILKVKRVLESLSVPYWLDYGTLLGAVREQGFIGHDLDIDIGIMSQSVSPALESEMMAQGFSKIAEYKLGNSKRTVEHTYLMDYVSLDFFFYDQTGSHIKGYYFHSEYPFDLAMEKNGGIDTIEVLFPYSGIGHIPFLGEVFPVPRDYHKYLSSHYGPDYLEPDTDWDYIRSPHNIKKIEEKGLVVY